MKTKQPHNFVEDDILAREDKMKKEQSKCSHENCENPASICFTCHGKECIAHYELWREKFVEKLKEELLELEGIHDVNFVFLKKIIDKIAEEESIKKDKKSKKGWGRPYGY